VHDAGARRRPKKKGCAMKDDPLFRELPDSFDERVPPPPPPEPRIRKWDVSLSTFTGLTGCAGILTFIAPMFGHVFRQMKVPMPGWTLMMMQLSDLALSYPIGLAAVLTALPASIHACSARTVAIGRVAIPILNLIAWGWMIVALFLPFLCILEGISPRR
jgi:hypothetical protein